MHADGIPVVDGTKKNCKGVIAELESAAKALDPGSDVDVLLVGVPNRIDVYAWAKRKGFFVSREERDGQVFRLTLSSNKV